MQHQARSHGQTGTTAATRRPPIPPVIKRNTLLLAVTQACVGVENQMVPALGAIVVLQLLDAPALLGWSRSRPQAWGWCSCRLSSCWDCASPAWETYWDTSCARVRAGG